MALPLLLNCFKNFFCNQNSTLFVKYTDKKTKRKD